MTRYHHKKIEPKWQKYWKKEQTFRSETDKTKKKFYVLDMFPYPSGAGLHVGHLVGYTATDIYSRYLRMQGVNVLHPMGWDSFGLQAEQYAVRTGSHPADTTEKNIANFRRQLMALGYCYDWNREIKTSDPSYYKWTQWIFLKLYEKGLAYQKEMLVNYCPELGTVLANEEVENGKAKEGGYPIERRPLKQWMLKITAYADRLIQDLDTVDWPESLKKLQINWIGKSSGASVHFGIEGIKDEITVFTTRPDTLYGVTFMVLAPEHPLVDKITKETYLDQVQAYRKEAASRSDIDRMEQPDHKTGVFTGAYAINPVNEQKIPIWIADYVLLGYGTGAVMGVPAGDERDFVFAEKFGLKIIPVVDPEERVSPEERAKILKGELNWVGDGLAINSSYGDHSLNSLTTEEAKKNIILWLEKSGKGEASVHYKLRDWLFSRQRYWGEPFPLLFLEDGTTRTLNLDELPLCPPDISDYKPSGDGKSPLAKVTNWVNVIDPVTGKKAKRETDTMPQWAGSCWYYLRFCDPHNDKEAFANEIEKYWMPVDLYVGGVEHAVLHLLYARFWHKVLFDAGLVSTNEPFQKLRNQGLIIARAYQKEGGGYVAPEDVEKVGEEYFLRATKEKLRSQYEKMSKSKLNGVSPDEILEDLGADSLRLYSMFMGPLEKEKVWNSEAVSGCRRFLDRFFDLMTSEKVTETESEEALRLGHKLVDGIARDLEAMQFNTAIAKLMEFINAFSKLEAYPKSVLKMATLALSPLAPHICEEIWEMFGNKGSIAHEPFPKADPRYLVEENVTIVVQVNGRVRAKITCNKDMTEDEVMGLALQNENVSRFLGSQTHPKAIFVPNRLLNIVLPS